MHFLLFVYLILVMLNSSTFSFFLHKSATLKKLKCIFWFVCPSVSNISQTKIALKLCKRIKDESITQIIFCRNKKKKPTTVAQSGKPLIKCCPAVHPSVCLDITENLKFYIYKFSVASLVVHSILMFLFTIFFLKIYGP